MAASGGGGSCGSRKLRVPHISVHASGMRSQRVSSSGGGGGAAALVSFAPRGFSPSTASQLSDIDFPRGVTDLTTVDSRATTALAAEGASVFRSRVSPNFRQALAEAKERTAVRRLTAQAARDQRRSHSLQPDSVSRMDGVRLVEEDADDADDVFEAEATAAAIAGAAQALDAGVVSDPRRRRALRRWGIVRDIIQDIHKERHAKKTEGWSMFFKHVRAMSEAEKTRRDLYERYNIFGDGKSDFMTALPAIPDCLLLAAGIPLPSTRARQRGQLGPPRPAVRGGRPPRH